MCSQIPGRAQRAQGLVDSDGEKDWRQGPPLYLFGEQKKKPPLHNLAPGASPLTVGLRAKQAKFQERVTCACGPCGALGWPRLAPSSRRWRLVGIDQSLWLGASQRERDGQTHNGLTQKKKKTWMVYQAVQYSHLSRPYLFSSSEGHQWDGRKDSRRYGEIDGETWHYAAFFG